MCCSGEVPERFNGHAWKACVGASSPQVRILSSPPFRIDSQLQTFDRSFHLKAFVLRKIVADYFELDCLPTRTLNKQIQANPTSTRKINNYL